MLGVLSGEAEPNLSRPRWAHLTLGPSWAQPGAQGHMPRLGLRRCSLRQLQRTGEADQAPGHGEEGGPQARCLLRLYLLLWETALGGARSGTQEAPSPWAPSP